MLPKNRNWEILLLVTVVIVAIFFPSSGTLVLLGLVAIVIWLLNQEEHYKRNLELEKMNLKLKKEVEERAEVADEKFSQVINAIPTALVYINQKGQFEIANAYFRNLIHEDINSVYDMSLDHSLKQIVLNAYLHEKEYTTHLKYQSCDYQILSVPLYYLGRYSGCIVLFQDVTHIMEGEKQQKRFVEDASHELRTPITSIKGMIEILNDKDFKDQETQVEFLHQIEKESNRLSKLVDDLLLQSRLRANQVYLEKTYINVRQFFEALIHDKRRKLNAANIKIELNCNTDLVVFADRFRLRQVFTNLMNNALNYAEGKSITIACEVQGAFVKIVFLDTGQGIDKDILPHIFERFYRGASDRSRLVGGSGLGLAISKSIVEAHGGGIEVFSEAGKGTRFEILLNHSE